MLEFAAEHRLVLTTQVAVLLDVEPPEAEARLESLQEVGLVRDARPSAPSFACDQITRAGLNAIGSTLPAPRKGAPGGYQHDVGLGWLWLAARAGVFGPLQAIVSERQMRSSDGRAEDRDHRFGVRLGGVGPAGRERLHYPDLVLHTESGHRVALELELTPKSRTRREGILAGYAADRNIDAVVYLVHKPSVGCAVAESARRLDIADLVHVQRVSFQAPVRAADPARAADRASGVGARRAADPAHAADRGRGVGAGRAAVTAGAEVERGR